MKGSSSIIEQALNQLKIESLNPMQQASIDAWKDTPVMNKESFERLQDIMEEAGELDVRAPFEKIVNNSYAEKVVK